MITLSEVEAGRRYKGTLSFGDFDFNYTIRFLNSVDKLMELDRGFLKTAPAAWLQRYFPIDFAHKEGDILCCTAREHSFLFHIISSPVQDCYKHLRSLEQEMARSDSPGGPAVSVVVANIDWVLFFKVPKRDIPSRFFIRNPSR